MPDNRVAIVTGAAMGYKAGGPSIGGAIAQQLAKDGYQVVVVDLLDMGQKTVDLIEANGGKAIFIQKDVALADKAKEIVEETVVKFGGLNVLVNCVARYGRGMAKNIVEIEEKEWDETLRVNLKGYFLMSKYSLPEILKVGGGAVVHISSGASFNAMPNFSVYSVSKSAINGLTRSMAVDFAPYVRTNAICPGFVKIANSENDRSESELKAWYERIAQQYPMKRVCEVEEIANVVSFLVSDKASYVNGQTISVDGGKSIYDYHEF